MVQLFCYVYYPLLCITVDAVVIIIIIIIIVFPYR